MSYWLGRGLAAALRRVRPAEGWAPVLSLAAALLALSSAVDAAGWLHGVLNPHFPVLLGMIFGLFAAHKLRNGPLTAFLTLLLGAGLAILFSATDLRALRDFALLRQQLTTFFHLLGDRFGPAALHPLLLSAGFFFALWLGGVWAGWAAGRWHNALRALFFPGILLGATLFFAMSGYFWGGVFLFAFALLAISLCYAALRQNWEARGVGYSPEIALDVYLTGFAIAMAVSFIALATPSLRINPITHAFWRVWTEPYATIEARISPLFSQMKRPPRSLIGGGSASPASLPRAHLLGGRPELTEQIIMTVQVDDPAPGAPEFWSDYRWRGPTYMRYTGRGWDNAAVKEIRRLGPGEGWLQALPADRRPLRQEVHFLAGRPYWLYAAGEPVAADISSQVFLRGPDDLLGMTAGARHYTVLSQAPMFNPEHLRAAPKSYPPHLAPALALPDTVSQRTRDLAARITADATNPYDQAVAIQTYLRQNYPYTLAIPPPPAGVDVTDYFLFDLQKGYCDYYATAMIVMARSLGVPARLAVGYAPGAYDARKNRMIVREKDAHSWPELYFPGYGWIPFEPTAARPRFLPQPRLRQSLQANQSDVQTALQALRRQGWLRQAWAWGRWLALAALLAGVVRMGWREWRLRRQAANAWQRAWLRLEWAGPRFGALPAPWLTPREAAARWQEALTARYPGHPAVPALLADIQALAGQVEARAYAPPARRPDDAAAGRAWRKIHVRLLCLIIGVSLVTS